VLIKALELSQPSAGGLSQSAEQPVAGVHGVAWLFVILLVMFA